MMLKIQALKNITVVLEEAGSGLQNMVKVRLRHQIHHNPFLTLQIVQHLPYRYGYLRRYEQGLFVSPPHISLFTHSLFSVDVEMVHDMPARTCVAVKELPFKAGVEIECIAHL